MFENVAEHLDEAVRLAERCPEKYQIACFQALIRILAQFDSLPSLEGPPIGGYGEAPVSPAGSREVGSAADRQRRAGDRGDIFLDQHQISSENISRVYHLDGGSFRIIVKNLKERTNSKKQVKLALLLGVQ